MAIAIDVLISPETMGQVDRLAAQSGILSVDLMERAGAAVAASALKHYPQALRFIVLSGPGHNGGDGYVAARYLRESGAEVVLYTISPVTELLGDANWAFQSWNDVVSPIGDYVPAVGDLVIDAVFGAGLKRALSAELQDLIQRVSQSELPVIAVDLPSGVSGDSGAILGSCFKSAHTVTFAALKPGHVLLPGAIACGEIELIDIGIPQRILQQVVAAAKINDPALWRASLPSVDAMSHKYKRGHLTVFSGGKTSSGAARLSAEAAMRAGAGIVTLAVPDDATAMVCAHHLTTAMQTIFEQPSALEEWLQDKRHETFVIGPGFGDLSKLQDNLLFLVRKRLVLDADGITAISRNPAFWFEQFSAGGARILTPHEGEFARLFPEIAADAALSKLSKAKQAAALSHSVIVYKGADTVIAAPDGSCAVNVNAPATLATAGSGDVLAGICGALFAQGVNAFDAACAAVWMHCDAAKRGPNNLNADDLARLVMPMA